VVALEEHHSRPHVDGAFVLAGEIVVEPGEEKLLDARLAIRIVRKLRGA
jgi:hypothetical protein